MNGQKQLVVTLFTKKMDFNLLKKHNDVIANRLFYGNIDLRHKVFA